MSFTAKKFSKKALILSLLLCSVFATSLEAGSQKREREESDTSTSQSKKKKQDKSLTKDELITKIKEKKGILKEDYVDTDVAYSVLKQQDESGLALAKMITKDLFSRPRAFDQTLKNIMENHSRDGVAKKAVKEGASYFRTGDSKKIKKIIQAVINSPDSYKFYPPNPKHKKHALELSKTFSVNEVKNYVDAETIGKYNNQKGGTTNRVVVGFGIEGIYKPSGEAYWYKGSINTAFPEK